MNKQQEIMDILQEECAEVIQAVSKARRFGLDNSHKSGKTQRENLETEIGDVLCMIELLNERGVIDAASVQAAILAKREKLHHWSNIFKDDSCTPTSK
jgi:NTP pyrophosphatase (non-canonical NTP hydrolase)